MTSKYNKTVLIIGSAIVGMFALAGTAFAATTAPMHRGNFARPAVVGTVASAPDSNGAFTVTAKNWQRGSTTAAPTTSTTYTVNTTSATAVTKTSVTGATLSNIAIGDTVMIQGTVSGSTVTATSIRDGAMMGDHTGQKPNTQGTPQMPAITGNGEPVVGGNVTAISGTTITITNKSNVTYTIDATNATITKTGVTGTATISNVVNGDQVVVQGTVTGTSVTASSVIDQGATPAAGAAPTHQGGFFGAIGSFFTRIFGFF